MFHKIWSNVFMSDLLIHDHYVHYMYVSMNVCFALCTLHNTMRYLKYLHLLLVHFLPCSRKFLRHYHDMLITILIISLSLLILFIYRDYPVFPLRTPSVSPKSIPIFCARMPTSFPCVCVCLKGARSTMDDLCSSEYICPFLLTECECEFLIYREWRNSQVAFRKHISPGVEIEGKEW